MENPASELGPQTYPWWPDWRGKACAIVACGPSVDAGDLAQLKDKIKVIAIKEAAVNVCPWADVVYGCDWPWWHYRKGLPQFNGIKIGWDGRIFSTFKDVKRVTIEHRQLDSILVKQPLFLGSGGNSGFQALNLAVQFGANKILLAGFDMKIGQPPHYYGRNRWDRATNPAASNFKRWSRSFSQSASLLESMGIDVVNVSQGSALECFAKASVAETVARWAL